MLHNQIAASREFIETNPDKGTETYSNYGDDDEDYDCLQKLTPIRGRKQSTIFDIIPFFLFSFTETNPDKGTETSTARFV